MAIIQLEQYQKDQIILFKSMIKQMVNKGNLDRNDCILIIDKMITKCNLNITINSAQYELIINQVIPATSPNLAALTPGQLARRIFDVPELKDGICNYYKN